jgi:ribosomal-protein-alanine N-acetyltransferase
MVARPPVKLTFGAMTVPDLPAVHEIERASFTTPWPPHAYRTELESNKLAQYIVLRADGQVIAYGGMWLMVDEAHITTFAVSPTWRRRHIGERLLLALLDISLRRGAHEATLEVRLSNLPARRLYEKYGFRPVGVRPRYYTDDNEDALIMTTPPLTGALMQAKIAARRAEIEAEPDPTAPSAEQRAPETRARVPGTDERAGEAPG